METITVAGDLDALAALDIRRRLDRATAGLRPQVTVDLRAVTSVHVAAVVALLEATRRARRNGGTVHINEPVTSQARHDLALASWFPMSTIHIHPVP